MRQCRLNGYAAIAAPDWAGSFPWVGHTTWYPCGAAPDDRTFLLCGTDQYDELRLGNDGKPQWRSAPADIPVAARNTGSNGDPEFAVSPDRQLAAVTTATGIMVLSLVTGATRSWTIPPADGSATGLSWAGDRYLAFQFSSQPRDNDAGGVRARPARDLDHFRRRRHLKIERLPDARLEPRDIVVNDVAAILAQVRGDAVGAGGDRDLCRLQRIGVPAAARIAHGGDVVLH